MQASSIDSVQLQGLLDRVNSNDPSARDELIRGFFSRLEVLTRKMLRSHPKVRQWEHTSDVMQSSMVRLMRALDEVRPDSIRSLMNLAAVQIRRELLNLGEYYRQPRHSPVPFEHDSDAAALTPDDTDPVAPSENPDDIGRWTTVHEAVESLPDEEREVVSLVFYHGLTRARAGEFLGVSEKTVRRRWKSALVKIHRELAALGSDSFD